MMAPATTAPTASTAAVGRKNLPGLAGAFVGRATYIHITTTTTTAIGATRLAPMPTPIIADLRDELARCFSASIRLFTRWDDANVWALKARRDSWLTVEMAGPR